MGWQLGQRIINIIRRKEHFKRSIGKNNKIIYPKTKKDLDITINGENNFIKPANKSKINITIYGHNNSITFDESINGFGCSIMIGTPDCFTNGVKISIGKNCTSNGIFIKALEDNSEIIIGNDVMFSTPVYLDCSDTHTVYDKETKEILNVWKYIKIGNHVWCGKNVTICKNSTIPDDCVIGLGSVVTKDFTQTNAIIAGIPANIKKTQINWSHLRPKQYMEKLYE